MAATSPRPSSTPAGVPPTSPGGAGNAGCGSGEGDPRAVDGSRLDADGVRVAFAEADGSLDPSEGDALAAGVVAAGVGVAIAPAGVGVAGAERGVGLGVGNGVGATVGRGVAA